MRNEDLWMLITFYIIFSVCWVIGVAVNVSDLQNDRKTEEAKMRARRVFLAPVWPLGVLMFVGRVLWFLAQVAKSVFLVAIGKRDTLDYF